MSAKKKNSNHIIQNFKWISKSKFLSLCKKLSYLSCLEKIEFFISGL